MNAKGALDLNKITITNGSVTYAIKSRKLLKSIGIPSKLIKIDASLSKNGCTHGLEISRSDFFDAIKILKSNGIPYSVYDGYGEK